MHAFIVRPFGTKNGIDFERVERDLIQPALRCLGISGGTTAEFTQQGNIRTDMFEQLLLADLVVADISIHNANVFYELGLRHALRDKRTFLLKAKGDELPFDLKTDRYLPYDAENPGASLSSLVQALGSTVISQASDSPVYRLLPSLKPIPHAHLLAVPLDFREELERAEERKHTGDLQLLAAELEGLAWRTSGLRLIAQAQVRLNDWTGARSSLEAVREDDEEDLEANTLLGSVYQKLGELTRSDQALQRAMNHAQLAGHARAEIYSLLGSNARVRWDQGWREAETADQARQTALSSAHLKRACELYSQGFLHDRNHFYAGLNALALLTMRLELAEALPQCWQALYESPQQAERALLDMRAVRNELAVGVRLAIDSARHLSREPACHGDTWIEIGAADLKLLTCQSLGAIASAYRIALAPASDFAVDAAATQLQRLRSLGILTERADAALAVLEQKRSASGINCSGALATPHAILFTGHRIDAPDRPKPRFPAASEALARSMVYEAVAAVKSQTSGARLIGVAGGASGGDILFHEICDELAIPSRMYLAIPRADYLRASVAEAGPQWVRRFERLYTRKNPHILSENTKLPKWLRAKAGYSIWQRSNLWMLHTALAMSQEHVTLIALWNGQRGDGPGGTEDMLRRARQQGASCIHLDARALSR